MQFPIDVACMSHNTQILSFALLFYTLRHNCTHRMTVVLGTRYLWLSRIQNLRSSWRQKPSMESHWGSHQSPPAAVSFLSKAWSCISNIDRFNAVFPLDMKCACPKLYYCKFPKHKPHQPSVGQTTCHHVPVVSDSSIFHFCVHRPPASMLFG